MATFEDGEPWKKVLGPLFVYANSASNDSDWHQLWDDAKQQVFALVTFLHKFPFNVIGS